MFNNALLVISLIFILIGIIYGIRSTTITKNKIVFMSMITTFFLWYSILFLVSDYFTGNGFNDAAIYHIRYGLVDSGFREYWLLILLTTVASITSALIPYTVIKKYANTVKNQKTKPDRCGLIFFLFAALSFILSPTTKGILDYLNWIPISQNIPRYDYNKFYRSPVLEQISKKRNLVYIYAESLERTYFDESVFPGLIKELRSLESIGTSFTQIKQVSSTGWTIGGMAASQCGIPLITPSYGNSMSGMDTFLSNAICLGDLLSGDGYELSYLTGSSIDFAGTGKFYSSHGFKDVNGRSKLSQSLYDNNYQSGWGLYDDSLLDIAFDKFISYSREEKPFGIFLSTIDTHHPIGHSSISCTGIEYKDGNNPILNAVACSDYLISGFVNKILKSKYAHNTVIVISSDHLAMQNSATDLLKTKQRRNLFLVIDPSKKGRKVNKPGSILDVAPTLLPFIGYKGDIGLGRNLLEEESLVSKIFRFNAAIKSWRQPLQDFWSFPKVGINDEIIINSSDQTVVISKRVFKYPLLIEFEKNNDTIIRFQFVPFDYPKNNELLLNYYLNLSNDKPFLWVDSCEPMNTFLPFRAKNDYCVMFGRSGTKNINCSEITGSITISMKDIYNPSSKNHSVVRDQKVRENRYDINRFIAHAGGKIGGHTYTNSLEALNQSYKNGFRLFELDIIKTFDNVYVAAHDWKHWQRITGFKGDLPPTRSIFKKYKIRHKYTPMDMDEINNWFENHPDAILVTDRVNMPSDFSNLFVDKKRLMMELFTLDAVKEGVRANIKSAMPTWSILENIKGDKVQTLVDIGVTDIAASRRIIKKNIPLINSLKQSGIKLYVFHVNYDKGKDEAYVLCHDMDYIYGLYADEFDFQKKIDCDKFDPAHNN